MIVNCPSCPKKYKIDDNLIPSKGRLVQCSNCKEKWIVESVINETKINILTLENPTHILTHTHFFVVV